jgi:hypothetical protein
MVDGGAAPQHAEKYYPCGAIPFSMELIFYLHKSFSVFTCGQ